MSLDIRTGEVMGLVGESGCGKSTLAHSILRLIRPDSGSARYRGRDILSLNRTELLEMRRKMQIVFQDPYSSLAPHMTAEKLIGDPLRVHGCRSEASIREMVVKLLCEVGLDADCLHRFPHEFSGGQRQRIGIARALILNPEFVVCDEPVSALDVSVRAQVLNLMRSLQISKKLTYLFISHDLSVVKHISDRIAVMYMGKIVELADKWRLYANPAHPYTKGLLGAIPSLQGRRRGGISLSGDAPDAYQRPSGCCFRNRCPAAELVCKIEEPELKDVGHGHMAACHLQGPRGDESVPSAAMV
ncbi:MAG: ABC transporter ATP-binding protein [Synergistaceae bacterium]|nr:ABC transporter ATP-binding protein [Synergistaceae bacterium]